MSAENYFKAALDGVCEELRLTPPGHQARKLYDCAYRLASLVHERDLEDHWLDTVEYELVQNGLQMVNQPGREKWTEASIRKQALNGIRDAKARGGYGTPPERLQRAVQPIPGNGGGKLDHGSGGIGPLRAE